MAPALRFRPSIVSVLANHPRYPCDIRAPLLRRRMVVITDDPCNFPCAVFVLPKMNDLSLANLLRVVMSRVVEAVNAHLNRAIALHVIDLQSPWNEFPGHF